MQACKMFTTEYKTLKWMHFSTNFKREIGGDGKICREGNMTRRENVDCRDGKYVETGNMSRWENFETENMSR